MSTSVDTYNWDAAYAIGYDSLNKSIVQQWKTITANFTVTDADTGNTYTLDDVTFNPWEISLDGDGKNALFYCPIQSGSFSVSGNRSNSYPFPTTGPLTTFVIEVEMEWVPDPSQKTFAIADKPTVEAIVNALDSQTTIPSALSKLFSDNGITLDSSATLKIMSSGVEWAITNQDQTFYILYSRQLDENKQVTAEFLSVYEFKKQWQANLQLMVDDITSGSSAVTVTNILNSPIPTESRVTAAMLSTVATDWFNTHLADFSQIFAQANITTTLDTDSAYGWLTPTATSYAVTDGSSGDGVFGILMMTGGRAGLSNHQVSPDAIPGPTDTNPDGCDAAFVISGQRFVQDMLLGSAKQIFGIPSDDSSYFSLDKTGLIVTNAKDITWGPFINSNTPDRTLALSYSTKLDASDLSDVSSVLNLSDSATIKIMGKGVQWLITDGGTEYIIQVEDGNLGVYKGTVSITVPAKQFSLSLNNDQVTMQIINFSYPHTDDFTVKVTCEESWTLGLKEVNGKNIFWFTEVSPPKMTTTVTQNQSALTRQGIEGAIGAVLSLITVIVPVADALLVGVDVTETLNEAHEISEAACELDLTNPFNEEALQEYNQLRQKFSDLMAKAEAEVAEFQSQGIFTKIGNALGAAKWKAMAAIVGFAAPTALDVAIDKIIQSVANQDPQNYLPKFDSFAEFCIAPYSWPAISGFDLVSASLAGSLVIGLKAKSTS